MATGMRDRFDYSSCRNQGTAIGRRLVKKLVLPLAACGLSGCQGADPPMLRRLPAGSRRPRVRPGLHQAAWSEVHESEPAYQARAASIPAGSLNPAGKPAMPTLKHTPGLVVGTLNVIVNHA